MVQISNGCFLRIGNDGRCGRTSIGAIVHVISAVSVIEQHLHSIVSGTDQVFLYLFTGALNRRYNCNN